MKSISGAPAVSDFRLERLLADLRSVTAALGALQAHHVYFIKPVEAASASPVDEERLYHKVAKLLPLAELTSEHSSRETAAADAVESADSVERLVLPRAGTLSPWASKALDILENCGVNGIAGIERGVLWTLHCKESLPQPTLSAIDAVLHDRMTECVVAMADAKTVLFRLRKPVSCYRLM